MEMTKAPSSFAELQEFYQQVFRPLYDHFMNRGAVAQEIHAEMAAAIDHFLCKAPASFQEIDAQELHKVVGHLKRATFDGFKLIFSEEIALPYRRYMDGRYADVHDGKFRKEITDQWKAACAIADEARKLERESRGTDVESWHLAFDKWRQIMPIAEYFIGLGADETVLRAHALSTRGKLLRIIGYVLTFVVGVGSSILASYVASWLGL